MSLSALWAVGMIQKNSQTKLNLVKQKKLPLLQEVEIIYSGPKFEKPVKITSSIETYELLKNIYDERKIDYKEMFYVLLLNRANLCLGVSQIGIGSTSGVVVNVKEIFQLALKTNASAIILSHNHPSGNLNPSQADKEITQKVKGGCECMDMRLLDHLIITSSTYFSMADEGFL